MSDDYWAAFCTLHRGLPREGPGEAQDVAWATALAEVAPDARILDAACGPGADLPALRAAAPAGSLHGVDKIAHFVEEARARMTGRARVTLETGDMAAQTGIYDFVWCAGAVYFLGVEKALTTWRRNLAPGGAIAFSQVCWFTDTPPQAARDHWAGYVDMAHERDVAAAIEGSGYRILGQRRLSDAAWEAYYAPLDAAVAALRPDADGALAAVLDESEEEAAVWRENRDSFGYTLFVVRPA